MMVPLELVRCDRCGWTLYAKPHGIVVGEPCHRRIPGEFSPEGFYFTSCPGTFRLTQTPISATV